MTETSSALAGLLAPSAIALIGASDSSGWSRTVFSQWTRHAPTLPVYCVNPRRSTVHDRVAFASVGQIGEPVDLAYVMTAPDRVVGSLEDLARAGVSRAVILTGGFGVGSADGRVRRGALVDAAAALGMTVLGPNCNGFANVTESRVVYGGPLLPPLRPGGLGIVSQSGAIATRLVAMAQTRGCGLSKVITVGDQVGVSLADATAHLVEDESTRAVAMFVEGIEDTATFARVLVQAAEAAKPVVVLKVGRSEVAARAALDHTGAIAGDGAVGAAAMRQWGAIQVATMEDLVATAGYLAREPGPHARRIAVVAASGGAGELLADRAIDHGLELPALPPEAVEELREILPDDASVANPLDVTGKVVGDPGLLTSGLEVVRTRAGVDAVVLYTTLPRHPVPEREQADRDFFTAVELQRMSPGPRVCVIAHGAADLSEFGSVDPAARTPVFGAIDECVIALSLAADWWDRRAGAAVRDLPVPPAADDLTDRGTSGVTWSEWRSRELLVEAGIPFPAGGLAADVEEAIAIAGEIGWPVALKVVSDEILHKSDVGGVVLGVRDQDHLRASFGSILDAAAQAMPGVVPDGVLVTAMARDGVELLLSVTTDDLWGQVLTIGLGGIWVEVAADVSRRVLPVRRDDIPEMLSELRGAALLRGGRGTEPVALELVADVAMRVSDLARSHHQELLTIELNPLRVGPAHVEALDAIVRWRSR